MKIGDIELKWFGNSGFLIEAQGKKIYIDPYEVKDGKADVILITHPHYDHFSIEDLRKLIKEDTVLVAPAYCQAKLIRLEIKMEAIGIGEKQKIKGFEIIGIPAYNINKEFHPKEEEWIGYLIKIEDVSIYHAGDTDNIPEMQQLNGKVNVALLPVGGKYTMNAKEAAEAASIIEPDLCIPMHYGEIAGTLKDAEEFVNLCREKGLRAEILNKE